jgi:methylmalonyl-CoA/ethylmalonyl-CoA epimerase
VTTERDTGGPLRTDGGLGGIGAFEIDHVGIAVRSLEEAVERYRSVLGAEPVHRERMEGDGVDEALFRIGTSYVQLLGPTGPDTPVGRFLEKRGEGVHHVGYRVRDAAAAVEALRAQGVPLVDERPRPGSRGTTVAFAHPRGFGGVLVELVEEPSGREHE